MAQPNLDQLQQLIRRFEHCGHELACKHFFSGAALYVDGSLCASLTPGGLAFKLSQSRCDELISKGAAMPLQYFDSSPIKRGYVLFPEISIFSTEEVNLYFEECIEHSLE